MNKADWEQIKEEIGFRDEVLSREIIDDKKLFQKYTPTDVIAFHFQMILRELGQNLDDENLKDTPQRVAKYLIEFLNYDPGNHETVFSSIQTDQIVIVKDIPFWSLCSHHVLPFLGTVAVGYLTGSKVIGLS